MSFFTLDIFGLSPCLIAAKYLIMVFICFSLITGEAKSFYICLWSLDFYELFVFLILFCINIFLFFCRPPRALHIYVLFSTCMLHFLALCFEIYSILFFLFLKEDQKLCYILAGEQAQWVKTLAPQPCQVEFRPQDLYGEEI